MTRFSSARWSANELLKMKLRGLFLKNKKKITNLMSRPDKARVQITEKYRGLGAGSAGARQEFPLSLSLWQTFQQKNTSLCALTHSNEKRFHNRFLSVFFSFFLAHLPRERYRELFFHERPLKNTEKKIRIPLGWAREIIKRTVIALYELFQIRASEFGSLAPFSLFTFTMTCFERATRNIYALFSFRNPHYKIAGVNLWALDFPRRFSY